MVQFFYFFFASGTLCTGEWWSCLANILDASFVHWHSCLLALMNFLCLIVYFNISFLGHTGTASFIAVKTIRNMQAQRKVRQISICHCFYSLVRNFGTMFTRIFFICKSLVKMFLTVFVCTFSFSVITLILRCLLILNIHYTHSMFFTRDECLAIHIFRPSHFHSLNLLCHFLAWLKCFFA